MIRNVVMVRLKPGFDQAEVAHRGYDLEAHNRARARIASLAEEIARVQFEVP